VDTHTGIEWHDCTVKWQQVDAPALAAWVNGVGVIIYTTPVDTLKVGARVSSPYERRFRYVLSGHMDGLSTSIEQAQIDAVKCADCVAGIEKTNVRYKTREQWMKYAITVKA
jgi:hypothetical protein